MTSLALGLHEKLKKEGVVVSSPEYYKRIDNTMRQRFPEKFETDQETKSERSTRPSTVVAPATRSTSSKKIRLTTSQLSIAKKLGLTNEQYAQAVIKMES
jgi:spermidine synthase